MSEQLTPGVHVEETGFRSRSIEGVATSTFGMAGLTRYGPTPYILSLPGRADTEPLAMSPRPTLVSSFAEFERVFGGLDDVGSAGVADRVNYLAHAARAFFANGGRRLYVSRVFPYPLDTPAPDRDFAALPVGEPAAATFRARWPGSAGNEFAVSVTFERSDNILTPGATGGGVLHGVQPGAAVEIFATPDAIRTADDLPVATNVRIVAQDADGSLGFRGPGGEVMAPTEGSGVTHLTVTVTVRWGGGRRDSYPGLELDSSHPRGLANVLRADDPADEFSLIWFDGGASPLGASETAALVDGLRDLREERFLGGAGDGDVLGPGHLAGRAVGFAGATRAATGLAALAEMADVAIVATPDAVRFGELEQQTATANLIGHCEAQGAYRVGLIDPPKGSSVAGVRRFRAGFDSRSAALYYPWVEIADPTPRPDGGASAGTLQLPPSGFMAGIYARGDLGRGVHAAPANEVIQGATGLQLTLTTSQLSELNAAGINTLRFLGGASLAWGARTISSDPEWKYVNVRRLLLYLEHSIDRSTQWAVFEPNDERLWTSVRQSIADFLTATWRTGALAGARPEQAFFVRCDRTTMTQDDLDNGRLVCVVGVAPIVPAEFVTIRIGQWTADAQRD